ncbi:MAG: S8 family serine peptidase [Desulfobacterales bacterium]
MKYIRNDLRVALKVYTVALALVFTGCGGSGGGDQETTGSVPTPLTFTLSGIIQAPDNALIDRDVNDPLATYAPNDNFIDAQELPNPVILGGYVNLAGTGPSGRSQISGDESDFFRVSLIAGQIITLFIAANPTLVDLDLYLYDDSEIQVDAAMGTGSQESLVAPADGNYFIEVRAVASVRALESASNYNLTIGQSTSADLTQSLRLSDEFVSGEVIVRFEDDDPSSRVLRSSTADRAQLLGMQTKAGAPGRGMLLRFDEGAGPQETFRALGIRQTEPHRSLQRAAEPRIQRKADTLLIIKSLRRRADVRYAQPNYIRKSLAVPNDPQYPQQWHYPLINLPQSWDVTTGSNTVIVAVIDSGVLLNHPDLENRLTSDGYDFISDPARSWDGDGIDPDPDDPGDGSPGRSSFHGTHVSGTIAAETNNIIGVAGVTWSTRIMPLRAIGQGGGTDFDILQAVRYAAGFENDSGTLPAQKADIINLSLGGSSYSPVAEELFAAVRGAGITVVAAAGNSASNTPFYPAAYEGVLSVSAVDIRKDPAQYSNFGTTIDLAAPGGDNTADINADGFPDGVLSTCGTDPTGVIEFVYCFFQGTSMAAPHVAGVVALMKAIYPSLTPGELDILLANGLITEDLGPAGRDDQFGHGLIDAFGALVEAQNLAGGGVTPLTLIVSPAALNLGPQSTASLMVAKAGGNPGDPLLLNAVTADVPWLIISEDNVDTDGLGTYTVIVDRNQLTPGTYSATITVDAEAPSVNDIEVPVSMQVITPIVGGNAGFHYVLLVDSETFVIKARDNVPFSPGGYAYAFTNVTAGTYQIFAGTDSNNDFIIGDPGEAFGAYLTLDQPVPIIISNDQGGLDFISNFDVSFPSQLDAGELPGRPTLRRFRTREVAR